MIGSRQHGIWSSDRADSQHLSTSTTAKQCEAPNSCKMVDYSESTTINVDIIGPMRVECLDAKRYCLTMATAPHRYVRADLMWNRADVAEYIYDFVPCVDRNAKYKTERTYCDNAPEFIPLPKGLRKLRITTTSMKSPQELWFKKAANNASIKVFRCQALVHKHRVQGMHKLHSDAEDVSYMWARAGMHRDAIPSSEFIVKSKHVHFDETVFAVRIPSSRQAVFTDNDAVSPNGETSHENHSCIHRFKQSPCQTDESRSLQTQTNAIHGDEKVISICDIESTSTEVRNVFH